MGHLGTDLTEIAVLLIGVAGVALLIGHYQGTVAVIQAGTTGFNTLLNTVENPSGSSGLSGLSSITSM